MLPDRHQGTRLHTIYNVPSPSLPQSTRLYVYLSTMLFSYAISICGWWKTLYQVIVYVPAPAITEPPGHRLQQGMFVHWGIQNPLGIYSRACLYTVGYRTPWASTAGHVCTLWGTEPPGHRLQQGMFVHWGIQNPLGIYSRACLYTVGYRTPWASTAGHVCTLRGTEN